MNNVVLKPCPFCVQLFEQDFESYEFCLEALCELSYLVDGIPAMQTVKHSGLEEGDDNG